MTHSRLSSINDRIAVQGKLALQNLIELENTGVNLVNVDRDEVSRGNVSYDKYLSVLKREGL